MASNGSSRENLTSSSGQQRYGRSRSDSFRIQSASQASRTISNAIANRQAEYQKNLAQLSTPASVPAYVPKFLRNDVSTKTLSGDNLNHYKHDVLPTVSDRTPVRGSITDHSDSVSNESNIRPSRTIYPITRIPNEPVSLQKLPIERHIPVQHEIGCREPHSINSRRTISEYHKKEDLPATYERSRPATVYGGRSSLTSPRIQHPQNKDSTTTISTLCPPRPLIDNEIIDKVVSVTVPDSSDARSDIINRRFVCLQKPVTTTLSETSRSSSGKSAEVRTISNKKGVAISQSNIGTVYSNNPLNTEKATSRAFRGSASRDKSIERRGSDVRNVSDATCNEETVRRDKEAVVGTKYRDCLKSLDRLSGNISEVQQNNIRSTTHKETTTNDIVLEQIGKKHVATSESSNATIKKDETVEKKSSDTFGNVASNVSNDSPQNLRARIQDHLSRSTTILRNNHRNVRAKSDASTLDRISSGDDDSDVASDSPLLSRHGKSNAAASQGHIDGHSEADSSFKRSESLQSRDRVRYISRNPSTDGTPKSISVEQNSPLSGTQLQNHSSKTRNEPSNSSKIYPSNLVNSRRPLTDQRVNTLPHERDLHGKNIISHRSQSLPRCMVTEANGLVKETAPSSILNHEANGCDDDFEYDGYFSESEGSSQSNCSLREGYSSDGEINSKSTFKTSINIGNLHHRHENKINSEKSCGSKNNMHDDENIVDSIVDKKREREPSRRRATLPTMQGTDRIYYRKVKEILEAPPNKGPPYTPSKLSPHIYIGNIRNAEDFSLLARLGVTHVLNLAGSRRTGKKLSPYPPESGVKHFLMIPAQDNCEYDIAQHFHDAIRFLDSCKSSGGRALVHCNLGINRSGAISAVYLLHDTQKSLLQVVSLLKEKRSVVLCNRGFRRQVIQFAREHDLLDPLDNDDLVSITPIDTPTTRRRGITTVHVDTVPSSSTVSLDCTQKKYGGSKSDSVVGRDREHSTSGSRSRPGRVTGSDVTPSLMRPLRLSSSTTSVPGDSQEKDEEENNEQCDKLDTLYEEIDGLKINSPRISHDPLPPVCEVSTSRHNTASQSVLRSDDPRYTSSRSRCNGIQSQEKDYLTVPQVRHGRLTSPSRTRLISSGDECGSGRSSSPSRQGTAPVELTASTSRRIFNGIFRRKPVEEPSTSTQSKPSRHSARF